MGDVAYTPLPGSLGGHDVFLLEDPRWGLVVRKVPAGDASMEHEVAAHRAVSGLPGVVQLLEWQRDPWSLTTAFVAATRQEWTVADADAALRVLSRVGEGLPVIKGVRVMGEHAGDNAAAARAEQVHPRGAGMRAAWDRLRGWDAGELVMAHGDPRPENWVLTDAGPVLLDFGAVALAPPRWDAALFLAHLPGLLLGQRIGLAEKHGVPWGLVETAAWAWWALAVDANQSSSPLCREWATQYSPLFERLAIRP